MASFVWLKRTGKNAEREYRAAIYSLYIEKWQLFVKDAQMQFAIGGWFYIDAVKLKIIIALKERFTEEFSCHCWLKDPWESLFDTFIDQFANQAQTETTQGNKKKAH